MMDNASLMYWLGFLVRILAVLVVLRLLVWCVFYLVDRVLGVSVSLTGWRLRGFDRLEIKSQHLELGVTNLSVSLRWFNPSCRHLFKINIGKAHLDYVRTAKGDIVVRSRSPERRAGLSWKHRIIYWILGKILKLTELSVRRVGVWIQDGKSSAMAPGIVLEGQLSLIARPMPYGELGLSMDVEKMIGQLFVQMEQPCTYTEDGLYPLFEFKLSAKTFLLLQPLSVDRGLIKSLQFNVVPLTVSLVRQDLMNNLLVDYGLPSRLPTETTPTRHPQQRIGLLPEKVEVVLENVGLVYQAPGTNRVLSSKVNRVSVASSVGVERRALTSLDTTLGVQDFVIIDSQSRKTVTLQQLRLVTKMTSKELSNKLHIDSLKLTLWDKEVMFWSKYARETCDKIQSDYKLKSRLLKTNTTPQLNSLNFMSCLFNLPLSVVASLESSDWLVHLHSEAPTLQAKEPLCQVVMATCAGNIQWDSLGTDKTTTLKSSLRLANAYLQVPGYHPTIDNPTFFRQRLDNPQALPSLRNHLWGRVVSIGGLVLKAERGVRLSKAGWAEFCDGVSVKCEGCGVMLEVSNPTTMAIVKSYEHLKTEYGLFKRERSNDNKGKGGGLMGMLSRVDLQLQLTEINLFLYALTPEPPSLMIRLDAGSFSTLPCPTLTLHRLLVDDMHLGAFTQVFVCSDTASLPHGAGVLYLEMTRLTFDPQIQDLSVSVSEVTVSWSSTAHRCVHRTIINLLEDINLIRGVLGMLKAPTMLTSQPGEVVAVGDVLADRLMRLQVSLNTGVDKAELTAQLDKRTKVSLALTNIQSSINGGVLMISSQEITTSFDGHKIITLLEFITRFPQPDTEGSWQSGRGKLGLQRQNNTVLWVQAARVDLIFPYDYNFSLAYDKMTNVRKFLQKLHSSSPTGTSTDRFFLLPDISAECEDILLQISDDPFEIKLRANYELLCDEYKEKNKRHEALKEKLNQVRQEQGVTAVSGEKVQSLYSSLEVKDSEIYCRRAVMMYNCPEDITTGLFRFSMEHTKLTAMFDPSLLGEENLVRHLKEIDSQCPLPDDYSFSTLWGCYVNASSDKLQMQLRDYPTPLIAITEVTACGRMILAEQEARDREVRSAVVEVGHPWSSVTVKRKLPPLKYYYDLKMTSETWDMQFGPCLEPALAQTSIGFGRLTSPAIDPSRPLPYWDKLRLLFHGPLHLSTKEMRLLLPSTFNPYNDIEYLELRMCDLELHLLSNTQLDMEGALQLNVHTASKYNDCSVLDFPCVKSSLKFNWVCGGKGPHDHHHVVRCAPDRVPVLPDNQVHDSYGSFRSLNLDVEWNLVVQPQDHTPPQILLFSSTLRCLQQYQALHKWNVTRPTRRGNYFKNLKPKRPPVLRHVRDVKIIVSFPKTSLQYWSSISKQRGVECALEKASLNLNYHLRLVPRDAGLIQRPQANWTIVSCRGKVGNLMAYVKQRAERKELDLDVLEDELILEPDAKHTRSILLSLEELVYSTQEADPSNENSEDDFTHQLETKNTKLLWNLSNKRVMLGLFDAYNQSQMLKRDLSAEALKAINKPPPPEPPSDPPIENEGVANRRSRPSSGRLRQLSSGNAMLDTLLADISNHFVQYVDERAPSDPLLKGVAAGSMNDVKNKNWIITLTNTQIALQGSENSSFALASSHVAQVFGREHHPQLKDGGLVSKKSWVGKIQELQYFSTVWSEMEDPQGIPWLPLSVICPPLALIVKNPAEELPSTDDEAAVNILLGKLGPAEDKGHVTSPPPGEAVGGLVSSVLIPGCDGVSDGERRTVQLQRIASRCHCQVFYVTYGEVAQEEDSTHTPVSSPPNTESRLSPREAVDTLTVRYPGVSVCTTSSQYALIMDILNNLLLNKEAKKKEAIDRKARMQFTLQLADIQDPRRHVQAQQNRVRKSLQTLRELQTTLFLEKREDQCFGSREDELCSLIHSAKEELSMSSNTLRAMIVAFKHNQLDTSPSKGHNEPEPADPIRRIEIWVDDAHWWLTQDDGQLKVANICFTNFSYNRVTFSNDSGEHRLELGTFSVQNLMPNTRPLYQHVLHPYDPNSKHLRVDKNICLRVYCKDKAPVAGISVKEHLEVNVVPLSVSLTAKFYQTMQDFFVPKADEGEQTDPDHSHLFAPSGIQPSPAFGEPPDRSSPLLSRASSVRSSAMSINTTVSTASAAGHSPPTSPVPKEVGGKTSKHNKAVTTDAVEKMKERASHIKTFIYVKIPQCTLNVTYKSENVSLKDIQNGRFTIPTLEYHNKNWTWTDMLMELKKDIKTVIVQQTLKSVVGMKETDERAGLASPKMARKGDWSSDMLLGSLQAKVAKSGKKLFSKLSASSLKDHTHNEDESKASGTRKSSRQSKESPKSPSTNYMPPLSESAERTSRNTPTQDS